jgi:two-component system invasion response regulator UvrY
MNKITVLIVDDHTLIRETWSFILNSHPKYKVVAGCASGEEAIELVREHRPEIVLLDINLKGMSGMETVPLIRKYSPASKILAVSLHTQPSYARQMILKGAMGYVTKNSPQTEFLFALNEIHRGRKYICKEIKNILSEQVICSRPAQTNGINALSQREIQIIGLIKKGYSSREIATSLNITPKTIDVHRYNILKKLNLKNTAALVNFINQNNLGLE